MPSAHTIFDWNAYQQAFAYLYTPSQVAAQTQRYQTAVEQFCQLYGPGSQPQLFSAPGRTEIGGNHTDHQRGRVLAAAVDLDVICVARPNEDGVIRVKSHGYPQDCVGLDQLDQQPAEQNKAIALLRGVASRFVQLGYPIGGCDVYTTSNVLAGSGLSSSAAYEVALGTILNHLFCGGAVSPLEIAQIGQYAENVYFGKPCGLLDQSAASVGGFVTIDFADPTNPLVQAVNFDFAASGHALCIVDTGGDHADLTPDYAAIPREMSQVAAFFGKEYLRQVDPQEFYDALPQLRQQVGDRSVLRAMHFFADDSRVAQQVEALESGDFAAFKQLIRQSGQSSFMQLQNCFSCQQPQQQGVALGLAHSQQVLGEQQGGWRVHGGGFAGTIQAFVPHTLLEQYIQRMEHLFGQGCCYILSVRPVGGVAVTPGLGS